MRKKVSFTPSFDQKRGMEIIMFFGRKGNLSFKGQVFAAQDSQPFSKFLKPVRESLSLAEDQKYIFKAFQQKFQGIFNVRLFLTFRCLLSQNQSSRWVVT